MDKSPESNERQADERHADGSARRDFLKGALVAGGAAA